MIAFEILKDVLETAVETLKECGGLNDARLFSSYASSLSLEFDLRHGFGMVIGECSRVVRLVRQDPESLDHTLAACRCVQRDC